MSKMSTLNLEAEELYSDEINQAMAENDYEKVQAIKERIYFESVALDNGKKVIRNIKGDDWRNF